MRGPAATLLRVVLVALLPALAGCASSPPPPKFAPISFAEKGVIRLDVAAIEVSRDYASLGDKPYVEHLFRVMPADAVALWARERLAATGGGRRRAVLHIADASVKETELPRTTGIRGLFTTDQGWRYDAVLEVTVDILDSAGVTRATATSRVERRRSAPEDMSLNEREEFWYALTKDVMTDLDASLDRQIRDRLNEYVAR